MKFSEQWLREFANPKADTRLLTEQMTMLGLEVEQIEPIASGADAAGDHIITLSITPNRGDCLSIRGIAREIAAVNQLDYTEPAIKPVPVTTEARRHVQVNATDPCPYYSGRVIEAVDISMPSPEWLTERLACSGIRSINIVTDITNYVMLELGQPLHAFDNDALHGDICVRYGDTNETLKLLDGSTHTIQADTLLISDERAAIAIAGIMGGLATATNEKTRNIFLESAFFQPAAILGKGRKYSLHTESSRRFERGVDYQLPKAALERATAMIIELCGGKAGPITEALVKNALPKPENIRLRKAQIKRILGVSLTEKFIKKTFESLNMQIKKENNQWFIKPSSYRFDIKIEADLIEELARFYHYDRILAKPSHSVLTISPVNRKQQVTQQIRDILINRSYQEVISYSFTEPKLNKLLTDYQAVMLANPIAPELAEMRTSVLAGLVTTLNYNLRRQQEDFRLFEIGMAFRDQKPLSQEQYIGGLVYYHKLKKQADDHCLSRLKLDVETMLTAAVGPGNFAYTATAVSGLHPQQSVAIMIADQPAGYFGKLHPDIASWIASTDTIYGFELQLKSLTLRRDFDYQPVPKFPPIKRDLSLLFDKHTAYQDIANCIKGQGSALLTDLALIDSYQGKGIDEKRKSLTFSLTFQAKSSTLRDNEIEIIIKQIIDSLYNKFGATLRQ